MKKFILMILCVTTFFVGLGGLVEKAGARFKSDERALELLRQARQAVGGDQAINGVRSLTVSGRATKTFDFPEGARTEQGDWELNLQLPNQMSRMLKLRKEGTGEGKSTEIVNKEVDVIVVRKGEGGAERVMLPTKVEDGKNVIVVRKADGSNGDEKVFVRKGSNGEQIATTGDGKTIEAKKIVTTDGNLRFTGVGEAGETHRNDLFRTTLALFLTAPEGLDVSYTYAGEGNVDGTVCDVINAAVTNGSNTKLYLDKTSHLPVMVSYQAPKRFMIKIKKDDAVKTEEATGDVKILRDKIPAGAPEMAEYQIKFSDFRSVNGLQLPFRWTQTVGGKDDEVIDITSYDLNPANIAEKFKELPKTRVFLRTKQDSKPQ